MTLELLFPHFDELIRTPEDVQRLNEAILQLAVQGKLVPQDPEDEPASELLKRMEIDKERLAARKLISSSGRDVVLDQTQVQYVLPNQWSWAAVADVGYIERGVSFPASAKETTLIDGHIACLRTTNIQANVDWQDLIYIPRDYVTGEAKLVYRNDIMISMANSFELVGKVSYVDDLPMEATFGGFIAAFRSIGGMYARYVFLVMKSSFMQEMFRRSSSQTTNIANISLGRIYPLPFPVPPFAEQHRIVAKVDELFAQTRALEAKLRQAQADIVTANRAALHRLHRAQDDGQFQAAWRTLRDHFDVLYDDPRNVADLRQAILDLAVRGKLVPQDAEDEPAVELLKRIGETRNGDGGKKKSFGSSFGFARGETPYTLPPSWLWAPFSEVAVIATNSTDPGLFPDLPHIAPDNIEKFTGRLLEFRTVAEDDVSSVNHRFFPGQILYSKIRPNLSKAVVIDFEGLCSADMYPIQPLIDVRYLHLFILSSTFLAFVTRTDTRVAMPKVNQEALSKVPVAVPPLAEQHRIVAKVDQLMRLCDALQAGLVQAEVQRRSLTAAVLIGVTADSGSRMIDAIMPGAGERTTTH